MSRFAKSLLVLTAFAPVLFTYAFQLWLGGQFGWEAYSSVVVALGLVALCALVLVGASKQLERYPFKVVSLRTADTEVLGFVIAYLLPLVAGPENLIRPALVLFVLFIFLLVVWGTHAYHFNPLLGIVGFHFYEVSDENSVNYVLVTRKGLRNTGKTLTVVQLTDYMVLDVGGTS